MLNVLPPLQVTITCEVHHHGIPGSIYYVILPSDADEEEPDETSQLYTGMSLCVCFSCQYNVRGLLRLGPLLAQACNKTQQHDREMHANLAPCSVVHNTALTVKASSAVFLLLTPLQLLLHTVS